MQFLFQLLDTLGHVHHLFHNGVRHVNLVHVVGVPGRIVRLCGDKLDHIHTPDPVMLEIEELKRRMALLEQQINDVQKEN